MSDIEKRVSVTGENILAWQGRRLASLYDPHSEALNWINKYKPWLPWVRSCIVLGAGSGFHIRRLMAEFHGQILVLDPRAELISANRALVTWDRGIDWIRLDSGEEWSRESSIIGTLKLGSYLLLDHSPSQIDFEKEFESARNKLRARDWRSLHWLGKLRDHSLHIDSKVFESTGGPLGLQDIASLESASSRSALLEMLK